MRNINPVLMLVTIVLNRVSFVQLQTFVNRM